MMLADTSLTTSKCSIEYWIETKTPLGAWIPLFYVEDGESAIEYVAARSNHRVIKKTTVVVSEQYSPYAKCSHAGCAEYAARGWYTCTDHISDCL